MMTKMVVNGVGRCILVLVLFVVFSCAKKTDKPFSGHKVLRIKRPTSEDVQRLLKLEQELKLDFWLLPRTEDGHLDVRVGSEYQKQLIKQLQTLKLEHEELISDVQKLIDQERRSNRRKRATSDLSSFTTHYLTYNEINEFLYRSAAKSPNFEVFSIGQSLEGRNTYVIKLGTPNGNANKPAIFIDAGFHAREWIAPATAINFIYQLAENPTRDNQITDLLSKFDFYVAPIVNPDGYEYSRQPANRLWRKNRRIVSGSCAGVDLNRNFGFHWDPYAGGSTNPCSDLYAGNSGFSEPESNNIKNFLLNKKPNIKAYLTLHSYGQYWLYPWGYSTVETIADENILKSIAIDATRAMDREFTIGASAKRLYVAAGGSDDYAKGVAGVPYAYTVELWPTSYDRRGFILPAYEIPNVAKDTLKGFKAFSYSVFRTLEGSQAPPTPAPTTRAPYIPPQNNFWQQYYQNYFWNKYFGK